MRRGLLTSITVSLLTSMMRQLTTSAFLLGRGEEGEGGEEEVRRR